MAARLPMAKLSCRTAPASRIADLAALLNARARRYTARERHDSIKASIAPRRTAPHYSGSHRGWDSSSLQHSGGDLNVADASRAPHRHPAEACRKRVKTAVRADSVRVMGDHPLAAADIIRGISASHRHAGHTCPCHAGAAHRSFTENISRTASCTRRTVRMGANIKIEAPRDRRGGTPLSAAAVLASDLRASASLVLAAWSPTAKPSSTCLSPRPWLRNIEEKLKAWRGNSARRQSSQARGSPAQS